MLLPFDWNFFPLYVIWICINRKNLPSHIRNVLPALKKYPPWSGLCVVSIFGWYFIAKSFEAHTQHTNSMDSYFFQKFGKLDDTGLTKCTWGIKGYQGIFSYLTTIHQIFLKNKQTLTYNAKSVFNIKLYWIFPIFYFPFNNINLGKYILLLSFFYKSKY